MSTIKDKLNKASKNEILFSTDYNKGVYKLKDFCDTLKNSNCILDTKVFAVWRDLVNSSLYDSIRFVTFNKVDGITYGQWVACKHDLVITEYERQKWEDFYPLNENTSYVWEKLLFQSAVKPVDDFSVDTDSDITVFNSVDLDEDNSVFKVKVRKIKISSKKNRKV